MFVGHYATAFALKGVEKNTSLAALFIAVQWVDILFFPLAVLGIEKLEFIENFTAVNDFNMYFYPYTHGLLSSLLWAVLTFGLVRIVFKKSNKVSLLLALAVLSHWFLDVIVHTPDLPLVNGEPKVGLGFWNNKNLTFWSETVLLLGGFAYYRFKTKPKKPIGKWTDLVLVAILLLVGYLNIFVLPKADNVQDLTVSALASYFVFALMAMGVDKTRW